MTHSFPKIIWQTHNHKKEWLPHHLNMIAGTWANLNPGWQYRYVDQVERDEKIRQYPEIYEVYKYRMPTVQSDIWRFIITYEEGGCYADMDSVCRKPLDYMLQNINSDSEIITVPENDGMGNTHNYIVKPKSQVMKMVIDKMAEGINKGIPVPSPTYPFSVFVDTVYSYPNTCKLFDAANHSNIYKKRFLEKEHTIDYYGKKMQYDDFVNQNNLNYLVFDNIYKQNAI